MTYTLKFAVCGLLFLSLVSYKINRPWELMHDDDGSFFATVALSHVRYGLKVTKAHNFQIDKETREVSPYPNHPAGLGLALAPVVAIFGPRNTAALRATAILFHLMSLVMLVAYIKKTYGESQGLTAAYVLALIPMSSFFGRCVSFYAYLMPAMICFVLSYMKLLEQEKDHPPTSWMRFQQRFAGCTITRWGGHKAWVLLLISALWGCFIDWPMFFAIGACLGHSLMLWRTTANNKKFLIMAGTLAILGLTLAAINLAHSQWAFGASGPLKILDRLSYATSPKSEHPWTQTLGHILEFTRRYYTEVLLLAALIYLARQTARLWKKESLSQKDQTALVFFVSGVLMFVLIPNYARIHHYMGFYLIPFMVLAFIETLEWLKQKYPKRFPTIQTAALILITISSLITLAIRHTRLGGYAIQTTQQNQRFM